MNMNFDESKSTEEKNDIILKEMQTRNLSLLSVCDIVSLGNILFRLFKENFENNNHNKMTEISKCCKTVVDSCIEREFYTEAYCTNALIDIACFVFEQMYMYEDKVNILKTIIESNYVNKLAKIRALEELLNPEPETQQLISEDADKYSVMLAELRGEK